MAGASGGRGPVDLAEYAVMRAGRWNTGRWWLVRSRWAWRSLLRWLRDYADALVAVSREVQALIPVLPDRLALALLDQSLRLHQPTQMLLLIVGPDTYVPWCRACDCHWPCSDTRKLVVRRAGLVRQIQSRS